MKIKNKPEVVEKSISSVDQTVESKIKHTSMTVGWDGGFKKSNILKLSEQIYEKEQEKIRLTFELSDEEFHLKNIPERRNRVRERLLSHIKYYFVLVPFWGGSVFLFLSTLLAYILGNMMLDDGMVASFEANEMLISGVIIIYSTYPVFKFFVIPDFKDIRLLWNSRNTPKGKSDAEAKQKNSFQIEYEKSKNKVDFLRSRIQNINTDLKALIDEKNAVLMEQFEGKLEEVKKKDLWNIKSDEEQKSKFNIKKEENTIDYAELFDFYKKEEFYYRNYLSDVEIKLSNVNKEIYTVYDKYNTAKKVLMYSGIIFVFIIFLQRLFSGWAGTLSSLVCLGFTAFMAIRIERYCTPAFVNYLVEEESDFVSEYVFRRNIVPFRRKRDEIMREKDFCLEKIESVKRKKKELDNLETKIEAQSQEK